MPPLIPPIPPIRRLNPAPTRSSFLFGPRGTGKSTYAHQCFTDARLAALAEVPVQQQGPITVFPLARFLLGIAPLPA